MVASPPQPDGAGDDDPMPLAVRPMLAWTAAAPFDSPLHLFEPKWDGLRAVAFATPRGAWLQSRHLQRWTWQFPEVIDGLEAIGRLAPFVVDGELVAAGPDGHPDFEAVLARSRLSHTARARARAVERPVTLVAFDALYLDGVDLRASPLHARRKALERWQARWQHELPERTRRFVTLSPAVTGEGIRLFEQMKALGMEGMMAKDLEGPYLEGYRSRFWLKVKAYAEERMAVVGFVPEGASGVKSLAVAAPQAAAPPPAEPSPGGPLLVVAGLVGSGLSAQEQRQLRAELELRRLDSPPPDLAWPEGVGGKPASSGRPRDADPSWDGVVWVEPSVQVRVRYLGRTSQGWIRHASFQGLAGPGEAGAR